MHKRTARGRIKGGVKGQQKRRKWRHMARVNRSKSKRLSLPPPSLFSFSTSLIFNCLFPRSLQFQLRKIIFALGTSLEPVLYAFFIMTTVLCICECKRDAFLSWRINEDDMVDPMTWQTIFVLIHSIRCMKVDKVRPYWVFGGYVAADSIIGVNFLSEQDPADFGHFDVAFVGLFRILSGSLPPISEDDFHWRLPCLQIFLK